MYLPLKQGNFYTKHFFHTKKKILYLSKKRILQNKKILILTQKNKLFSKLKIVFCLPEKTDLANEKKLLNEKKFVTFIRKKTICQKKFLLFFRKLIFQNGKNYHNHAKNTINLRRVLCCSQN